MAISGKRRNNSWKKTSLAQVLRPRTLQTTLLGEEVEDMPLVRTSDGFILPWSREAIIKQLLRETPLAHTFYGIRQMKRGEALRIAEIVEKKIKRMDVHELSGPLIREFVNVVLLEEGYGGWARVCSRVGTSLYDAYLIDHGEGFEAKENSNLTANPETSAKKKHDKLSKATSPAHASRSLLQTPTGRATITSMTWNMQMSGLFVPIMIYDTFCTTD